MTVILAGVLWLITSNYAVEIRTLNSITDCAAVASVMQKQLDQQPRPVLGRAVCVPFPIFVNKPGKAV